MYNYQITRFLAPGCDAVMSVRLLPLQLLISEFFLEPFLILREALLLGMGLGEAGGACSNLPHS